MAKMRDPRGELTQIKLQRTRLFKKLQQELEMVEIFCEEGGKDRDFLLYFEERRKWLREQISWLYLFTKKENGEPEQTISS